MNSFLFDVFTNIVADVVFLFLLLAVGWFVFRMGSRRQLRTFFGTIGTERITIYISSLNVISGGSRGSDGYARSYSGVAVPYSEAMVSNIFRRLFTFPVPTAFDEGPSFFSRLLLSDLVVDIAPAPELPEQVDTRSSFITLGSPGYNTASQVAEDQPRSLARFTNGNAAFRVGDLPEINDPFQAFVSCTTQPDTQRRIFYAAGISELGTLGAAYYLTSKWRRLYRNPRNTSNFAVVIKVNQYNYQDATTVAEVSGN